MFPDIEEFNFLVKARPEKNTFTSRHFCFKTTVNGDKIYLYFEKEEKETKLLCSEDTYNLIKMIHKGYNDIGSRKKASALVDKYNVNIKKKHYIHFNYDGIKNISHIYFNL